MVNGTPSIERVMLGAPEPSVALARMTSPVDAGSDTVVDADPADVRASASPLEALLSETTRPAPDCERAIVSNSTDVVGAVAFAVAVVVAVRLALAVADGGTDTAASLSRRVEINPTAVKASAGTDGVSSEPAPDTNAMALAAGEGVMADADGWLESPAGVVDWVTGLARARRVVAAGAGAFFRDDEAVPDAVDACEAAACAGPDDDELEPAVSA